MKNEIPVLFMANDESLSQAKIFLTNFRQFNPKTPLFLIPFGTQVDSLLACQDEFNFSVVDYDFTEIDALSEKLAECHSDIDLKSLRKLSVFDLGFDCAIYLSIKANVCFELSAFLGNSLDIDANYFTLSVQAGDDARQDDAAVSNACGYAYPCFIVKKNGCDLKSLCSYVEYFARERKETQTDYEFFSQSIVDSCVAASRMRRLTLATCTRNASGHDDSSEETSAAPHAFDQEKPIPSCGCKNNVNFKSIPTSIAPVVLDGFNVSNYQRDALNFFINIEAFEGKRVLEIGGSNIPKEVIFSQIKANQWVSVDILSHPQGTYQHEDGLGYPDAYITKFEQGLSALSTQQYIIFDNDFTDTPQQLFESFDVVVSIATLEHVVQLPRFLNKVSQCLKPGGHFFSHFGPIWSSYAGHHSVVSDDINFNNFSKLTKWAHLLHTPPEMFNYLIDLGCSPEQANYGIYQMYTSSSINRFFAEDYIEFFSMSDFEFTDLYIEYEETPPVSIQKKLENMHPMYKNFSTYSFLTFSQKKSS